MTQAHRVLDAHPVASLDDYLSVDGGHGFRAAQYRSQESLIALIQASGLRGRGGAGFPTGKKWSTIATAAGSAPIPVVVNAAEGEPGTFKDRMIIRRNPYRVLEGACIAALAVGADEIIIATKASFTHEIERLSAAIDEVATTDWATGIEIRIVTGPGEYLFGEETAMLEVVDGRPPFPRVMAPYRRGVRHDQARDGEVDEKRSWRRSDDGAVALVDNVETLANIPGILRHGADWFRSIGTEQSPGTIVCTVSGATRHDAVGEFAMGTPLRDVIDELGAGLEPGAEIAAVLSGVSNPPLGADQLDVPVSYEDMAAIGSGLGSASFIVIDDHTPLGTVAAGVARFLAIESCGQCEACKRDGLAIAAELSWSEESADHRDPGRVRVERLQDRLDSVARGARCALAGQTERVVGRLIEMAGGGATHDPRLAPSPIAPIVDLVGTSATLDETHLDKRPDWTYVGEEPDSGIWPVHRLADHPVDISRVHAGELDTAGDADDLELPDAFASLHELHRRLERSLSTLRRAPSSDVGEALATLRHDLDRHRRATERLIYPLVSKLSPEIGDDVVWYPQRHEQHATRLLARLDLGEIPLSPGLIDELCADVHTSIIELDLRVLPLLAEHIEADVHDDLLIAADIENEITDEP